MSQYLTINQLAEQLQISVATVYRWRERGLPVVKVGHLVRFDQSEVLEWLKAQRQKK